MPRKKFMADMSGQGPPRESLMATLRKNEKAQLSAGTVILGIDPEGGEPFPLETLMKIIKANCTDIQAKAGDIKKSMI
jgi:hypothetical protein